MFRINVTGSKSLRFQTKKKYRRKRLLDLKLNAFPFQAIAELISLVIVYLCLGLVVLFFLLLCAPRQNERLDIVAIVFATDGELPKNRRAHLLR